MCLHIVYCIGRAYRPIPLRYLKIQASSDFKIIVAKRESFVRISDRVTGFMYFQFFPHLLLLHDGSREYHTLDLRKCVKEVRALIRSRS